MNHVEHLIVQNPHKDAHIIFFISMKIVALCVFSPVLTFVHSNLCPDTKMVTIILKKNEKTESA